VTHTSMDLSKDDIILTLDNTHKPIPGFIKGGSQNYQEGQFAKAMASGYLKFTQEGKRLSETDSVQSFITLADLHRSLTEEAQHFLREDVPYVYEDQLIQPLLLHFSAFRLKQLSRRYYFATLQNQPKAILDDLKNSIKERQNEYEALLQCI
jgi:hypothetical protein